ncbi:hypothetical protein SALWKB2_0278 [Snodgrassella alvi wkB2]|nr:hypothetical protein SALWKB2_0278 [Snodgrassella alvi wkB2]
MISDRIKPAGAQNIAHNKGINAINNKKRQLANVWLTNTLLSLCSLDSGLC